MPATHAGNGKEQGLTQQGLAERLGSHQEAVARMERDRYRGVSLERLVKVAEVLQVRVLLSMHGRADAQSGPDAPPSREPS